MSGVNPANLCSFLASWCGGNSGDRVWVTTDQFYAAGVDAKGDGPKRWAQSVGLQCSRANRKSGWGWYVWKEKEVNDD